MAVQYDSEVTGKGDPNSDILAVQKALDQGGSVLLKGTFDFGKDGNVKISKDVSINGETDVQGAPITKIKGGFWTIQSTLPDQLPIQKPGPKVGIQGIHFEGALWTPIFIPYCSGADIINNKITNVKPIPGKVFGSEGMFRHQGILLAPLFGLPEEHRKYQPGALTGSIVIADNDIDMRADVPEKTMAQGVLIIGATGANTQILRNRVVNCSRNSLESLDNYPGEDGSGSTIFRGNKIITANKGIPLPNPYTPSGIVAGWFLDISGASDPERLTKIVATENQIETRGENSIGIVIFSDQAVITSNHILLKGGPGSTAVFQANSDSIISNNKIEGAGSCAVMFSPLLKGHPPCRNVVMKNDFTVFEHYKTDVILSGSRNLIMEKDIEVVERGRMNTILK
jgi:hypothetical protein